MSIQLITAQTEWAVELEEVKKHLRVTKTGDDAYIYELITKTGDDAYIYELIYAAQAKVEDDYDLGLNEATYDLLLDKFPAEIEIWRWPIASITSVKYTDADGDTQTVSDTNYKTDLFTKPARIVPISTYAWPATIDQPNAVQVRFVTGFTSPAVIPGDIKQAMYLIIGDWYDNREDKGRRFSRVSEKILNKYKYK